MKRIMFVYLSEISCKKWSNIGKVPVLSINSTVEIVTVSTSQSSAVLIGSAAVEQGYGVG